MLTFIIFGIAGLFIIFLSYLIKYKKMAHLISGYNEEEVTDKNGLCNWIGGILMWPGIAAIVTGFMIWQYPAAGKVAAALFGAITLIMVNIAVIGAGKFKK